MISKNSNSFSAYETSVEDVWEADDEEFISIISKAGNFVIKFCDKHLAAEMTAKEVMRKHSIEAQKVI